MIDLSKLEIIPAECVMQELAINKKEVLCIKKSRTNKDNVITSRLSEMEFYAIRDIIDDNLEDRSNACFLVQKEVIKDEPVDEVPQDDKTTKVEEVPVDDTNSDKHN